MSSASPDANPASVPVAKPIHPDPDELLMVIKSGLDETIGLHYNLGRNSAPLPKTAYALVESNTPAGKRIITSDLIGSTIVITTGISAFTNGLDAALGFHVGFVRARDLSATKQVSGFFRLPAEIRNNIYKLAFPHKDWYKTSFRCKFPTFEELLEFRTCRIHIYPLVFHRCVSRAMIDTS